MYQGQSSLLDQLKTYSGLAAIAAATTEEQPREREQERRQRSASDSDPNDDRLMEKSSRVTRSQDDTDDIGTLLTPERKFLEQGLFFYSGLSLKGFASLV